MRKNWSRKPEIFFEQIGIKSMNKNGEKCTEQQFDNAVLKKFSEAFLSNINDQLNNGENYFKIFYSNLKLCKLFYGSDFKNLCTIAEKLSEISVPANASVLDIGGGPGPLAFWMAHTWNPASIVVTDSNETAAIEWARTINENRVQFTKSKLPELTELSGQKFDVIIMSRVLSAMAEWKLPENMGDIEQSQLQFIISQIEVIGHCLKNLIKPGGQIIVVDSWSNDRVLMVARGFEKAGLNIDLERFLPGQVGLKYSIIAFTDSMDIKYLNDLPYCLSTVVSFPKDNLLFKGTTAKSFRSLFDNGAVLSRKTFHDKNDKNKSLSAEVIEKEGLLLVYIVHDDDQSSGAWLYPAACVLDARNYFYSRWKMDIFAK